MRLLCLGYALALLCFAFMRSLCYGQALAHFVPPTNGPSTCPPSIAGIAASLELCFHDEGYARLYCSPEFVRAGHFDGAVSEGHS